MKWQKWQEAWDFQIFQVFFKDFMELEKRKVDVLENLINELSKLPGIGKRSASKLAFHAIRNKEDSKKLSSALSEACDNICMCEICHNYTSSYTCSICSNKRREENIICIVEDPSDLWAVEKTGAFKGSYHVLHGLISPLAGIGPDDLKLNTLIKRIGAFSSEIEVILAMNPTVEGEATSMYIKKILEPFDVKITKIAFGVPMGSDLEYVDKLTLSRALEHRRAFD